MNRLRPLPSILVRICLYLSSFACSAQNWTVLSFPGAGSYLYRIACAADGSNVVVAGEDPTSPCNLDLYTSTNSGSTWGATIDYGASDVAGSADGSKWVVANALCGNQFLDYSQQNGWLPLRPANIRSSVVASSANESNLVASGVYYATNAGPFPQAVLRSTNAGTSWQIILTNVSVTSLASSADGLTLVAATPTNFIYISPNGGATWSTNTIDTAWSNTWNALTCSADGSRLFAASGDGIFISTNAGQTWNRSTGPDSFTSIAVSADGTQMVAGTKAAVVYSSTNSGDAWTQSNLGDINPSPTSVAMAADGSRMFAAVQFGNVYTLQATPPLTPLRIATSGTNLSLFWPFPGGGFLVQEQTNMNVNAWADLLLQPSINLTTLQNEIDLPLTSQPTFFRLVEFLTLSSTFQDLDFESATLIPLGAGSQEVQFATAFPGWAGYTGTNQPGYALYDNVFLDSAGFGIQTNRTGLWDGRYYASIEAGSPFQPGPALNSYLSQTGMIPAGAHSILFKASGIGYVVSINGQPLALTSLGGNRYGANVINFGGTTAELRFTVMTNAPPSGPVNIVYLDSISFSTRSVP